MLLNGLWENINTVYEFVIGEKNDRNHFQHEIIPRMK